MVSINQIKAGLGDYIEAVMLPRMDSKRKFVTGIAYILIASKMDQMIREISVLPAIKILGIIDPDGNVDIDSLYKAAKAQIERQGELEISIKMLGDFKFRAADIDELYRYILNGGKPA